MGVFDLKFGRFGDRSSKSRFSSDLINSIQNLPHTETFLKNREMKEKIDRYNKLPFWKKWFTKTPKSL